MNHIHVRGSALLGSLMLITLLSMSLIGVDTKGEGGSGLMQVIASEHRWVQRDYLNAASSNLAEAGLEQALDDIAKSWTSGLGYSKTENLGVGSYTVKTISSTATTYTLESTGQVSAPLGNGTLTRKLQLVVKKGSGNDTPYAVFSGGNVNFKRSSVAIYGAPTTAIHANGNFQFQGSVGLYALGGVSYAGVTASGNISTNGSLAASESTSGVDTVSLPSADFSGLKAEASAAAHVIDGNYTVIGGTIGCDTGITYIKGNLKLEGDVKSKGTLVVEGNVDVKGTLKPNNTTQNIEVIAQGNVNINDSGASSSGPEVVANIYSEGNVKLSPGSPWIKGSVVAQGNVEFTAANGGSFRLDYVTNATSKLTKGTGVSVSDWKEVY